MENFAPGIYRALLRYHRDRSDISSESLEIWGEYLHSLSGGKLHNADPFIEDIYFQAMVDYAFIKLLTDLVVFLNNQTYFTLVIYLISPLAGVPAEKLDLIQVEAVIFCINLTLSLVLSKNFPTQSFIAIDLHNLGYRIERENANGYIHYYTTFREDEG